MAEKMEKIEFRAFARSIQKIVIYETKAVSMILFHFETKFQFHEIFWQISENFRGGFKRGRGTFQSFEN